MPRVEGRVRRSRCPGRSFPDTSSIRAASMLGRDETESGHSENKPTAFQGCAYCPARRGYHWLLWTAWLSVVDEALFEGTAFAWDSAADSIVDWVFDDDSTVADPTLS